MPAARGPRRPSPAQEIASNCLAARARHLERTLARVYDGALRGTGVTASQLGMLVAIELGGPLSASALGRILDLEKSTVSRNLARLAAAGLVETADGLRITARGSDTIRACHPLWRRAQRQAAAALDAPHLRLLAALPAPGPKR